MVLNFFQLQESWVFVEGIKNTFISINARAIFKLGYCVDWFQLEGYVYSLGDFASTTVFEFILEFILRWFFFAVGNTDLVERDDRNSIINLRYGVKNMTVNWWSNNYEFVFRRENFEGVYRSELVICNFFSCHVCNSALAKLTSGFGGFWRHFGHSEAP